MLQICMQLYVLYDIEHILYSQTRVFFRDIVFLTVLTTGHDRANSSTAMQDNTIFHILIILKSINHEKGM